MRSALARMAHRRLCANLWALHVPAVGRVVTRLVRWAGGCRKLRPYDIFVFPVIDWDYRFQRPQHLSLEFARSGHRVFYISTKFLRSEEHTSELQSHHDIVCRLLLEKKK